MKLLIMGSIAIALVCYLAFFRKQKDSGRKEKIDKDLLNLVFGDRQKYERLVRYHGSTAAAKDALLQDRRSWR